MQTQKQYGHGEGEGMKFLSEEFKDLIESLWKMEQTSNKVLRGIQRALNQTNNRIKNVRLPVTLMDENDKIRKNLKYFEKENEKLAEKISTNASSLVIMFHESRKLKEEKQSYEVEVRTLQKQVHEWKLNYEKKEKECQELMCEKMSLVRSFETLNSKHNRKEDQIKRLNEELKQLEDTFDAIKSQSQLYVKNNEIFAKEKTTLMEDNQALKKKISELQRIMTEKISTPKKEQDMQDVDSKIAVIVHEMDILKRGLDLAKKELSGKNEDILKLNKMISEYKERDKLQKAIATPSNIEVCDDTLSSTQPSIRTLFHQIGDEGSDLDDVLTKVVMLKSEFKLSHEKSRTPNISKNNVLKTQHTNNFLQDQLANIQTDLTNQKLKVQELETCLQEKETEYKYELHTMNERLDASEKNNQHYKNYISILRSSINHDVYKNNF